MANQQRSQSQSEHPDAEVLERGDIFFLYRPKLDVADPEGLDDVQRFHVVLRRQGGHLFRLLTIGRKRLPTAATHEREWGFVELIADQPQGLRMKFVSPADPGGMMTRPREGEEAGHVDREAWAVFRRDGGPTLRRQG